jgi:hypothetical protein
MVTHNVDVLHTILNYIVFISLFFLASEGCASGNHDLEPTAAVGSSGRCDPMPREGESCSEGDGFCVISWGSPGGYSSALWCRDGRWIIENESNLPD